MRRSWSSGGEEEAALFRVLEPGQQDLGQLQRQVKVLAPPAGLQQLQQGIDQVRIVVQVGVEVGLAVLVGGEQAPVPPQGGADEVQACSADSR